MNRSLLRLYFGLDRDIYVLFVAQLVNAMGNFVFPFLTLLLVKKLGYTPAEAGVVLLIVSASSVLGSLAGGKLSDRFGRKSVIATAQSVVVLLYLLCALFGQRLLIVPLIIGAEFALGAIGPATNALVTDRSAREKRQAAFSLIYLGFNLGFAVGLFLAGLLFDRYLIWIFIGNALSTGCSMTLVLVFVRGKRSAHSHNEPARDYDTEPDPTTTGSREEQGRSGTTIRVLLERPYLLLFLGASFLTTFVYAQMNFALPLQLTRLDPVSGTTLYGTLMSVTAIYVVTLTPIVIAATKRFPPVVNQIAAAVLYAIGFGAVGFLRSFPLYLVAALVWTVGEILFATNIYVYVANRSPRTHRGRINALLPLVAQAGFALNPPLVGRYLAGHPLASVWLLMFVVAMVAAAVFVILALFERGRTASDPSSPPQRNGAETGGSTSLKEGPQPGSE